MGTSTTQIHDLIVRPAGLSKPNMVPNTSVWSALMLFLFGYILFCRYKRRRWLRQTEIVALGKEQLRALERLRQKTGKSPTCQRLEVTPDSQTASKKLGQEREMDMIFRQERSDIISSMTLQSAWATINRIGKGEFTVLSKRALQFALFRTYGITSISKLLVGTRRLSNKTTASKRYADTETIIGEFVENEPGSTRSIAAIARMNYIHSVYQKANKISNDDMLYTLSLFALEPSRWIERFGYRPLSDVELCAYGVFWRYVGECQGIDISPILDARSTTDDKNADEWTDGLHFLQDLQNWSLSYEIEYMKVSDSNAQLAKETIAILLSSLPSAFRKIGGNLVGWIMDQRLREAMDINPVSERTEHLFNRLFGWFLFLDRTLPLSLPRSETGMRKMRITSEAVHPKTGRYHKQIYLSEPWYVVPSTNNRWMSLQAIMSIIRGQPRPGDVRGDGQTFYPEGYLIEEVGPKIRGGKEAAALELEEHKRKIVHVLENYTEDGVKGQGCPFAKAFSA